MGELYDTDVLEWSEQQARLLRQLAAGERLNEAPDWDNIIEEVEALGRSEQRACGSAVYQALVHLLKLHAWPDSQAASHWRNEVFTFLDHAQRACTPSIQRRIDLADEYRRALRQVGFTMQEIEAPARPLPATCPYTLNELLAGDPAGLLTRLDEARP